MVLNCASKAKMCKLLYAIGCEINAKGKRQCNQYPWNRLAISATEIINCASKAKVAKILLHNPYKTNEWASSANAISYAISGANKETVISSVIPATEIGYAGNANEIQYAICPTVF